MPQSMAAAGLIADLATATRDLPNKSAWRRIEELLADASVPRQQWSGMRDKVWVRRRGLRD